MPSRLALAPPAGAQGKPFPDGAKMARIHWNAKTNEEAPGQPQVSGDLHDVDFMAKDSKRFADSGGWGYGAFTYEKASDDWRPFATEDTPSQEHLPPRVNRKDVVPVLHHRVAGEAALGIVRRARLTSREPSDGVSKHDCGGVGGSRAPPLMPNHPALRGSLTASHRTMNGRLQVTGSVMPFDVSKYDAASAPAKS